MLEMRKFCECCGKTLAPESDFALICSFECTFCAVCAADTLRGVCPNCGGNLTPRPLRSPVKLAKFPAAEQRIVKENGCPAAAR